MKKYCFLIFSFLFSFHTYSQIVNIPNAIFKAKLLSANSGNQIASTETPVYDMMVGNWVVSNYHTIDTNGDGQIQVSEASLIKYLNIYNSNIPNVDGINSFSNLRLLNCSVNQIGSLNISSMSNLISLDCRINQISTLNINNLTNLEALGCSSNQLTSLVISNLLNLKYFTCDSNQLTTLNLSGLTHLVGVKCGYNQLTTLNLRYNVFSSTYNYVLDFSANPNLQYICADEEDISTVQSKINSYGYNATCNVNSYCSFTPSSIFYAIQGSNKYDLNADGCDVLDPVFPNLKYSITDGINTGNLIPNASGSYYIPVSLGTHNITPQFENPTYFTSSPVSATVSFPSTTSPFNQNFCITPNGIHHDLEVVIIPIQPARPGFDATYKIKYKNKGTVSETATLVFNFNDSILDYISSTLIPTSVNVGLLSWNMGTILPFQNGEFVITLNVNSPTEVPAVNAGTILNYSANFNGLNTDETPIDNNSSLNQIVVNSFDPNDKTCLEGTSINPSMIGQYLHYKIRFENTGTFPAQNIVVKDLIDVTKFDINSLQIKDSSHSCVTRITNPDKVEFIFENINLPFDEATNDGYVVFKIKTKSTLVTGNTISNSANIYFDYNFPIITNTATSTFQILENSQFESNNSLNLFPVPAKDVLNISLKNTDNITSISIYNMLGQLLQTIIDPDNSIDVSGLKSGNYLIKIVVEKEVVTGKFVKE